MTGLLGGLLLMGLGLMAVSWLFRGLFGWVFRPRPWFGGLFGRPMMWGGMYRGGSVPRRPMPPRPGAPGMGRAMGGPGRPGMRRAGGPGMGGGPHR